MIEEKLISARREARVLSQEIGELWQTEATAAKSTPFL